MDEMKIVYIYIMEYYTAAKEKKIMKYGGKWMELDKIIILNEVTSKDKLYSLICGC